MQKEGVCFLISVHGREIRVPSRRDLKRVRELVCLVVARELAWCVKAGGAAEPRKLSMQEEEDMQVCVL